MTVMTVMKRYREEGDMEQSVASTLILLSSKSPDSASRPSSPGRVFECKTCSRQFSSFQALGGHRASHKRAKPGDDPHLASSPDSHSGPKVHACAICGAQFAMGQALGGHMRRHRAEMEAFSVAKKSSDQISQRCYFDLNLPPVDIPDGDFIGLGLAGKVPMVH